MGKFKTGDTVLYIPTNEECKVVSDKNIPYKEFNHKELFPINGSDFILQMPLRNGEQFREFIHAPKEDVRACHTH